MSSILRPCILPVALLAGSSLLASPLCEVESPDGKITARLEDAPSGAMLTVLWDNQVVISPSRVSLVADGIDWGVGSRWGSPVIREIDETYPVRGVHAEARNRGREVTLPIGSAKGENGFFDLRVQNDGVAWRFRLLPKSGRKVGQEKSDWSLPPDCMVWFQQDLGCYEGVFDGATLQSLIPPSLRNGGHLEIQPVLPLPITAELGDGKFILLTEAAAVDFADSTSKLTGDGRLRLDMHAEPGGWTTDDAVTQPWRVALLARNLDALVNSDLIQNLNPPPATDLASADWIKPGSSSWQWWCSGGPKWSEQSAWIEWTRQLGFPYYLVDDGWKDWSADGKKGWELLGQLAVTAHKNGVKLWLWMDSRDVADLPSLTSFLDRCSAIGIVGVKIDFIPKANRAWSNWYVDVLREAAKRRIMVNFHGATKPTGIERTWPNEVTRESVRGHEWQIRRYNRVLPPHHDTILPFTRYVIGHGDYTPTVFQPEELKGYTWPRELAQAVVFTSPFLSYADHPKNYLENPAIDILREIPAAWDETRVLEGSRIGQCAVFARRKGDHWFLGVINGGEARQLRIPLDFLPAGKFQATLLAEDPVRDDAFARSERTLDHDAVIDTPLRASSGFVARLQRIP